MTYQDQFELALRRYGVLPHQRWVGSKKTMLEAICCIATHAVHDAWVEQAFAGPLNVNAAEFITTDQS